MYSEISLHASASHDVSGVTAAIDTAARDFFKDSKTRVMLNISAAQPGAALGTASFATNIMTVTDVTDGVFAVGQAIAATGVDDGTVIIPGGSGTGGAGTYFLSSTPGTLASRAVAGLAAAAIGTASFATNIMTVTDVTDGVFAVGQAVLAVGVAAGTVISSFGTGSGGIGTYNLSSSPGTIAAEDVAGVSEAAAATASFATNVMTVTTGIHGVFKVGQTIIAAGVAPGTTILSLGTGTGGAGTYNLSTSPGTIGAEAVAAYTAPTLDVAILGTVDGTDYVLDSFAQKSGIGSSSLVIDACPRALKAQYTIGGTTPNFTFQIIAVRF